jgi:2-polyprenyl-3-methyl-5-hydroxy-6-metoxy-1,4-benzoquinol methylase
VGSSHGIFLEIAKQAGFSATGIEPDVALFDECRKAGYKVINGFFPNAKELTCKTFDVIIFNDSFEHIPDLSAIIKGITEHLNMDGIVVINIPSSDGLMFQAAFLLNKLGIRAQFERLWQKGFASPHLHYFNQANLKSFFEKSGFDLQYTMRLSYYLINGLWKRIRCKSSFALSLFSFLFLVVLYPLFSIKSDCFVSVFMRKESL